MKFVWRENDTAPAGKGRDYQAEERALQSAVTKAQGFGPYDLRLAKSLTDLAGLYNQMGRFAEAEPLLARAHALYEKLHGPSHDATLAAARAWAEMLVVVGRFLEAESLLLRNVQFLEGTSVRDGASLVADLKKLAEIRRQFNRLNEVEVYLDRALKVAGMVYDDKSPEMADLFVSYAFLTLDKGRSREAGEHLARARKAVEETFGESSLQAAFMLEKLGEYHECAGNPSRAGGAYDKALSLLEKFNGPRHPTVGVCLLGAARAALKSGKAAKALSLARRSLEIRRAGLAPGHPSAAAALTLLADIHIARRDWAEAEKCLLDAWASYERSHGSNSPMVALCLNNLAELYHKRGAPADAERILRRVLDVYWQMYGPRHPEVVATWRYLADCLEAQDKLKEAEEALGEAEAAGGAAG